MLTANTTTNNIPAYTWVEQGSTCIAYELIGDICYDSGSRVVQYLYRVTYQIRHGGHYALGQIERVENGWVIRAIARQALPDGESLVYPTWEAARDYLWNTYQNSKRRQIRAAA